MGNGWLRVGCANGGRPGSWVVGARLREAHIYHARLDGRGAEPDAAVHLTVNPNDAAGERVFLLLGRLGLLHPCQPRRCERGARKWRPPVDDAAAIGRAWGITGVGESRQCDAHGHNGLGADSVCRKDGLISSSPVTGSSWSRGTPPHVRFKPFSAAAIAKSKTLVAICP